MIDFIKNTAHVVNGVKVIVSVGWTYSDIFLRDVFDDTEEYFEKLVEDIERGKLIHFDLFVKVFRDNWEISYDSLHSIIAESPYEYIMDDPENCVADMTENALEMAEEELSRLKKEIMA